MKFREISFQCEISLLQQTQIQYHKSIAIPIRLTRPYVSDIRIVMVHVHVP
jgi:hypothetical protein